MTYKSQLHRIDFRGLSMQGPAFFPQESLLDQVWKWKQSHQGLNIANERANGQIEPWINGGIIRLKTVYPEQRNNQKER